MRASLSSFLVISLIATGSLLAACAPKPYLATAKNADEGYTECHRYTEKKKYDKANECLELLRSRYRGHPIAVEAELEVADNHFREKDFLIAAEAYQSFTKLHPTYPKIDYVYYRIGLSYLRESPKALDRDQQYLDDALHWLELAEGFPESPYKEVIREKWREVRTRQAKRHFYVGRFYYRQEEYLAAIPRLEEVVTHYSELGFDERALYLLGRSFLGLDQKEKALEILSVFDQHFPQSPFRARLANRIGT